MAVLAAPGCVTGYRIGAGPIVDTSTGAVGGQLYVSGQVGLGGSKWRGRPDNTFPISAELHSVVEPEGGRAAGFLVGYDWERLGQTLASRIGIRTGALFPTGTVVEGRWALSGYLDEDLRSPILFGPELVGSVMGYQGEGLRLRLGLWLTFARVTMFDVDLFPWPG